MFQSEDDGRDEEASCEEEEEVDDTEAELTLLNRSTDSLSLASDQDAEASATPAGPPGTCRPRLIINIMSDQRDRARRGGAGRGARQVPRRPHDGWCRDATRQ